MQTTATMYAPANHTHAVVWHPRVISGPVVVGTYPNIVAANTAATGYRNMPRGMCKPARYTVVAIG